MDYLLFLQAEAEALTTRFVVLTLLASVANGALIATIITAGNDGSEQFSLLALFLISFLLYLWSRRSILDQTSELVEGIVRKIRTRICARVRAAELASFQAIGKTPVQQVLAQDCQTIYDAARQVMLALAAVGVVASSFIYIAVLSYDALVGIAAVITAAVLLYLRNKNVVRREYEEAAMEEQRFFGILSDQLDGFKELRLNDAKAQDFFDNDVTPSALRAEALKLSCARRLNTSTVLSQGFLFLLLGMIVFVIPNFVPDGQLPVAKIAAIVLFLTGPLTDLAVAAPIFIRANVAVRRLNDLEDRLSELTLEDPLDPEPAPPFAQLRCDRLEFRYPVQPGRADEPFRVGPLDLTLARGEVVFLVGGNGGGRATLLHLLCGLYAPTGGRLLVDGVVVTPAQRAQYRSHFAIILQDFHLFQRLLGSPAIDRDRVAHLLAKLRLTGITDVDADGRITNLNLSTGQKKRLALLVAECEDRDIFIFDEWAADQDPDFRRYFYAEYLPELRARGKTVLAATHDDHYFHVADRVLHLDRGQLRAPQASAQAGATPS